MDSGARREQAPAGEHGDGFGLYLHVRRNGSRAFVHRIVTHLAHKAEHAVDLETGAVVGVTVQDADAGDTTTMVETLIKAAEQLEAVLPAGASLAEVVGDKG